MLFTFWNQRLQLWHLLPREMLLSCPLSRELQTASHHLLRETTLIRILHHTLWRTLNGILDTPLALFMVLKLCLRMETQKNSILKSTLTRTQSFSSATIQPLGTFVTIFENSLLDHFIKQTKVSLLLMGLAHAYKRELFNFIWTMMMALSIFYLG